MSPELRTEDSDLHVHARKWNKVEINKRLYYCQHCGSFHTSIPAEKRVRCFFCGAWTTNPLSIKASKFVFYPRKQGSQK